MNPWTVPNLLTWLRFACAFWVIVTIVTEYTNLAPFAGTALWVFALGAATDWLDGYISRRYPGQRSRLGELIDPPADKMLVGSYCAFLIVEGSLFGPVAFVCVALMVLREVLMTIWRGAKGADLIPVRRLGKWKTGAQMAALFLYGFVTVGKDLGMVPFAALLIATAVTVWSFLDYVLAARRTA